MEEMEKADYEAQQQAEADAEGQAMNEQEAKNIDEIRTKMSEDLKEFCELKKIVEDTGNKLQEEKEILMKKWEEEHQTELNTLNIAKGDLSDVETELRALALEDYAITREKKLLGGLGIRIMKKLNYEPDKALVWAEEHGIGLTLDKRAFESFAKSQESDLKKAKLDFVEFKEEATATIPKEIKL